MLIHNWLSADSKPQDAEAFYDRFESEVLPDGNDGSRAKLERLLRALNIPISEVLPASVEKTEAKSIFHQEVLLASYEEPPSSDFQLNYPYASRKGEYRLSHGFIRKGHPPKRIAHINIDPTASSRSEELMGEEAFKAFIENLGVFFLASNHDLTIHRRGLVERTEIAKALEQNFGKEIAFNGRQERIMETFATIFHRDRFDKVCEIQPRVKKIMLSKARHFLSGVEALEDEGLKSYWIRVFKYPFFSLFSSEDPEVKELLAAFPETEIRPEKWARSVSVKSLTTVKGTEVEVRALCEAFMTDTTLGVMPEKMVDVLDPTDNGAYIRQRKSANLIYLAAQKEALLSADFPHWPEAFEVIASTGESAKIIKSLYGDEAYDYLRQVLARPDWREVLKNLGTFSLEGVDNFQTSQLATLALQDNALLKYEHFKRLLGFPELRRLLFGFARFVDVDNWEELLDDLDKREGVLWDRVLEIDERLSRLRRAS